MELTTLRKKVDPNNQHEDFVKTSLKTHYPKIYQEKIKNDYVPTHKDRTQNHLDQYAPNDFETCKHVSIQREKQLADVLLGKQAPIPLSNPIKFFTQKYINKVVREHFQREKTIVIYTFNPLHQQNIFVPKKQVPITKSRKTQDTSMMEENVDVVKGEPKNIQAIMTMKTTTQWKKETNEKMGERIAM